MYVYRLLAASLFMCFASLSPASSEELEIPVSEDEVEPLSPLDARLFEVISIGRPDDINILLGKGANPNAYNAERRRALAVAIERVSDESIPIAKALLDAGANPNVAPYFSDLPIIIAIRMGKTQTVWDLISHGVDYYVADEHGGTPLTIAESTKNEPIITMIKEAIARDDAEKAALRSNAALQKKVRLLSYYQCINSYTGYYIASGIETDEAKLTALRERALKQKDGINALQKEINNTFKLKKEDVLPGKVMNTTDITVIQELEAMVSNRYRKRMGVGTDADMKARCNRISGRWELDK